MLEILFHKQQSSPLPWGSRPMIFTDTQVLAVVHAPRPLRAHEREGFLAALATMLAGRNEFGDGELGRALARLQRQHFRPPTDAVT